MPHLSQEIIIVLLNKNEIFSRICEALEVTKASEVAEKLGITDGSVSQWKKTGRIALKTFLRVSELSNASIHWLVTGEGDKFVSRNTSDTKNKIVAQVTGSKDTGSASDKNLITQLPTAQFAIVPVPLIGTISASRQTIVLFKEPVAVKVPSILAREDTALFQIEGDELSAEGLHDGDLLIVHPPEDPLDGKLVIAEVDRRTIIRIYKSAGAMVALFPVEGDLPSIRFPKASLSIKFVVSSITRGFE